MSISRSETEKVAALAKLDFSDEELRRMAGDLGAILDYMRLLSEVDTASIEPLTHASDVANVFREDVSRPGLPREAMLANAPRHDGECYLVPAMLAGSAKNGRSQPDAG